MAKAPKLFNKSEAAQRAGIAPSTWVAWEKNGKITPTPSGLYTRAEIAAVRSQAKTSPMVGRPKARHASPKPKSKPVALHVATEDVFDALGALELAVSEIRRATVVLAAAREEMQATARLLGSETR